MLRVVLDAHEQITQRRCWLHVNPLDGPEAFLEALATLMQRDDKVCSGSERC